MAVPARNHGTQSHSRSIGDEITDLAESVEGTPGTALFRTGLRLIMPWEVTVAIAHQRCAPTVRRPFNAPTVVVENRTVPSTTMCMRGANAARIVSNYFLASRAVRSTRRSPEHNRNPAAATR